MARFYGVIGYGVSEETEPGIFELQIKKRSYTGDVLSRSWKFESSDNTNDDIKKIEKMFRKLFEVNVYFIENKVVDSDIYTVFLNSMCKKYINSNTTERIVIDYISGMTDDFFKKQYDKLKKYDIIK